MSTLPRYRLAPSILSADFAHLGDEVARIEPFADVLHVDAMDGHFVPPITIGPVVVKALKRITALPLECHLMVTDPLGQARQFAEAGASSVVAHIETIDDPEKFIPAVRELGLEVGLSVSPGTPASAVIPFLHDLDVVNVMTVNPGWAGQAFLSDMLPKIAEVRKAVDDAGLDIAIAVDGGIDLESGKAVLEAGATALGAASAIFSRPDPAVAAKALRTLIDGYAP